MISILIIYNFTSEENQLSKFLVVTQNMSPQDCFGSVIGKNRKFTTKQQNCIDITTMYDGREVKLTVKSILKVAHVILSNQNRVTLICFLKSYLFFHLPQNLFYQTVN